MNQSVLILVNKVKLRVSRTGSVNHYKTVNVALLTINQHSEIPNLLLIHQL